MARVKFAEKKDVTGEALKAWEEQEANNNLTNMKKAMLLDYATYDAYMGWYTSWNRLVEVIGLRAATIYAHSISTTNSYQLCSLFFISDLKALGIDPNSIKFEAHEELLSQLGQQIVKDPTAVSDEMWAELKKFYSDEELVVIVGFAGQMIATNNFNSVMKIDVDQRLIPIKDEFKPATWRKDVK